MKPWNKTDLARVAHPLDLFVHDMHRKIRPDRHDEAAAQVNTYVEENALALVLAYFVDVGRGCYPGLPGVEVRAAAKLHARLTADGRLPGALTLPRIALLAEQAPEPLVVPTPAPVAAPPVEVDPARERRVIDFNVGDTIERGETMVSRASDPAFDTELAWSDVEAVHWIAWACPAADRRGFSKAWTRCATDTALHAANSGPLRKIWTEACAAEPLPRVLDLRGIFGSDSPGRLPDEHTRTELARAINRWPVGIVLITDANPGNLGRVLDALAGV